MAVSTVRLSISQVRLEALHEPGTVLLDVEDNHEHVRATAIAWAQVRGYQALAGTIDRALGGPPPVSGYAAVINKPHALLVLATWPWAPARQDRTEPAPS